MNSETDNNLIDEPGECDVLGTRVQSRAKVHPGNIFYRELINKYSQKRTTPDEQKNLAQKIVRAIFDDKKGRFLKEAGNGRWVILNRAQSVQKAVLALKNAQYKLEGYPVPQSKNIDPSQTSATGIRKRKERPIAMQFVAIQGRKSIHPYTLSIISKAATEDDPETALKHFDNPVKKESETHQERMNRLHLRHRYYAAWDGDMTPRDFSRKLIDFWGGQLVERPVEELERPAPFRPLPPKPDPVIHAPPGEPCKVNGRLVQSVLAQNKTNIHSEVGF